MTLRKFLERYPNVIHNSAIILLVIGGALAVIHTRSGREAPHPVFPSQMFYTVDDGATLFVDDIGKIPPFSHNGKQAVRAYPFTCDGGQHQWVQYLETYGRLDPQPTATSPAGLSGRLVKKPGQGEWIPASDPSATEIMKPKKPWGFDPGEIQPVKP